MVLRRIAGLIRERADAFIDGEVADIGMPIAQSSTVAELIPLTARIETSTLGDRAALYGAIAVALREARGQMFSGVAAGPLETPESPVP